MLYGIKWGNPNTKKAVKKVKNFFVEVKKLPDSKLWKCIDATREKWQLNDHQDGYGEQGKMLIHYQENDYLGWRLYVRRTEKNKKFQDLLGGLAKVKNNAKDLKLGAMLIKQGKITKMPMPMLAKAIKRWHENGMQTKLEDFISADMKKNAEAYKSQKSKKVRKSKTVEKKAVKKATKKTNGKVQKYKVSVKKKQFKAPKKAIQTQIAEEDMPF